MMGSRLFLAFVLFLFALVFTAIRILFTKFSLFTTHRWSRGRIRSNASWRTHLALPIPPKQLAGPQHFCMPEQSPHRATQFSSAPFGSHTLSQEDEVYPSGMQSL